MNKQEQIQEHLKAIRCLSTPGTRWSCNEMSRIQRDLSAIEKLLEPEPEPETLAASVLRLTDLCNRLECDLSEADANLDAAGRYTKELKQELDVAIRSNVWLRERLAFKDESLRACRASEELFKAEVARQDELLEEAEELLTSRDACLKREFDLQERYIRLLKNDRRHHS